MTATAAIPPHDPMWWLAVGLLLTVTFVAVHLVLVTLLVAGSTTLGAFAI